MHSETIKATVDFWSPRYGRTITNEEAMEIIERFRSLFRPLEEEARRLDSEYEVKL
jgi:hypothetical protein